MGPGVLKLKGRSLGTANLYKIFQQGYNWNKSKYKHRTFKSFHDVYQSVNNIGSLAKFTRTPLGLIHFALHFDKPQKNGIHSLDE